MAQILGSRNPPTTPTTTAFDPTRGSSSPLLKVAVEASRRRGRVALRTSRRCGCTGLF